MRIQPGCGSPVTGGLELVVSVTLTRLSLCIWALRSGSDVARGSRTLTQARRGRVHPGPPPPGPETHTPQGSLAPRPSLLPAAWGS